MPRPLNITPAPFKSSYLAIPPSPFSPRLPITPPSTPPKDVRANIKASQLSATVQLLPPPQQPLPWLWQCHRCSRVYQLGVTRRCLDDGHEFCAGTTVVRRSKRNGHKKVLRHTACASEFDYQGWKAWGTWRRQVAEQVEAAQALMEAEQTFERSIDEKVWAGQWQNAVRAKNYWERTTKLTQKDCWNTCDYPSECRWGKQYGVATPNSAVVVPSTSAEAKAVNNKQNSKTSFDDILLSLDIENPDSPDYLEPLTASSTTRPASDPASEGKSVTEGETKMTSRDDLIQSAKRRKRRSSGPAPLVPSPLSSNPPSPADAMEDRIYTPLEDDLTF